MARTTSAALVANPAPNPRAVAGGNKPPKPAKVFGMDPSKIDTKFLANQAKKLGTIGAKLVDNAALATVTAKTRASWFEYGTILRDVRGVITSNTGFNAWLKDNDLERYADRNTRSDAIWMAQNFEPDFLEAHVPADRHSPKRIREWYRAATSEIIEVMGGETSDEATAKLNPDQRALFEQHNADSWEALVNGWKAKQANKPAKWADTDPQFAANQLLVKIAKHGQPGEVARIIAEVITGITNDPQASWAGWLAAQEEEDDEPTEEEGDEEETDEPEEGDEDEADEPEEGDEEETDEPEEGDEEEEETPAS